MGPVWGHLKRPRKSGIKLIRQTELPAAGSLQLMGEQETHWVVFKTVYSRRFLVRLSDYLLEKIWCWVVWLLTYSRMRLVVRLSDFLLKKICCKVVWLLTWEDLFLGYLNVDSRSFAVRLSNVLLVSCLTTYSRRFVFRWSDCYEDLLWWVLWLLTQRDLLSDCLLKKIYFCRLSDYFHIRHGSQRSFPRLSIR